MAVIHMLGRVDGAQVKTDDSEQFSICGVAGVAEKTKHPLRFRLYDEKGNTYTGTTTIAEVTCQKCNNLLTTGTIYGKRSA